MLATDTNHATEIADPQSYWFWEHLIMSEIFINVPLTLTAYYQNQNKNPQKQFGFFLHLDYYQSKCWFCLFESSDIMASGHSLTHGNGIHSLNIQKFIAYTVLPKSWIMCTLRHV